MGFFFLQDNLDRNCFYQKLWLTHTHTPPPGLTSVYGLEADDTHPGLLVQVLQLAFPVAAHGTVHLCHRWEDNRQARDKTLYNTALYTIRCAFGKLFKTPSLFAHLVTLQPYSKKYIFLSSSIYTHYHIAKTGHFIERYEKYKINTLFT